MIVPDRHGGSLPGLSTPGRAVEDDAPDARTRLLEAALEQIGRRGVRGASTREIIAAAGLRNPSAITYYFGSKSALVDVLVREVNVEQSAIIQRQVALQAREPSPAVADWVGVAVDAANGLLETERGCLLARVWADHDEAHPDAVEEFLRSDHELARAWRAAVVATLPHLPPLVAIGRNVVVLRMLQWVTVRRARRILDGRHASWSDDPLGTRPFLVETARNILAPPTEIGDAALAD